MTTHASDLARLSLLLQRIVDTEALYDNQGEMLLTETEAARRSLEQGDAETARRHIAQVARFTEALVQSDLLDQAEGRAVLETAHRLLAKDSDGFTSGRVSAATDNRCAQHTPFPKGEKDEFPS
jgi:hypothetical protein